MKLFILEYTHLSFIVKEIRIFILLLESNFKSRKICVCEEAFGILGTATVPEIPQGD